jgi:hypothetical protein
MCLLVILVLTDSCLLTRASATFYTLRTSRFIVRMLLANLLVFVLLLLFRCRACGCTEGGLASLPSERQPAYPSGAPLPSPAPGPGESAQSATIDSDPYKY